MSAILSRSPMSSLLVRPPSLAQVGDVDPAKLSVCMLAPTPFPANQGTPGSIREMAEAISERDHDVHIVTYHCGENIPVQGPRVHRIPALFRESTLFVGPTRRRPIYDMQMVFKTLQVMRQHPPDVLHAHGYEAALIAWICRLFTGVPIVYSGHNTMADELPSYRFIRPQWLARGLARLLDAWVPRIGNRLLPHSANMEKFFHGMGLDERTEPVVPFGIDLQESAPGNVSGNDVRQRYHLGNGPVILYSGLLDEFQRLDLLLEAMVPVTLAEPQARLLVVTTIARDDHVANLHARINQLGLAGKVVVTERLPLPGVRECLLACDVAVVARPNVPGFPIKLINYLAAKRPCVLFASSAGKGLVNRRHAVLATSDTALALGEAILEVVRDADLRQRLAVEGFRYVREHHDRRLVARQICQTYFRTLTQAGREPASVRTSAVSRTAAPACTMEESSDVRS